MVSNIGAPGASPLPNWLELPWQQVSQQVAAGRFAQTVLVSGDSGIGKDIFAINLAKRLLCESPQLYACERCHSCAMFNAKTQSDYFEVGDSGGLGVDSVRALNRWATERSRHGVAKVGVIHDVDRLSLNAANALLKTLEEPQSNTRFILLKDTQAPLLATIASRCQLIRLAAPPLDVARRWLYSQLPGVSLALIERSVTLPGLGPLDMLEFIEHGGEERLALFDAALNQFAQGRHQVLLEYLEKDRPALSWFAERIIASVRARRFKMQQDDVMSGYSELQLMQAYEGIVSMGKALSETPSLNFGLQLYRALGALL
jgi:DNA polymerase-3 subunit delta'